MIGTVRSIDAATSRRSNGDDPRTDEELLVASRSEPALFAVVYRRRSEELLRYLARQTADPHVAADLLAETFATAFRKRRRFRPSGQPGQTWLYGIARIEVARWRRTQQIELRALRRLGIDRPELTDDAVARIESMIDASRAGEAALNALDDLPPAERLAVQEKVVNGREYTEVAADEGTSVGTVRVRVHRGLKRLQERLT